MAATEYACAHRTLLWSHLLPYMRQLNRSILCPSCRTESAAAALLPGHQEVRGQALPSLRVQQRSGSLERRSGPAWKGSVAGSCRCGLHSAARLAACRRWEHAVLDALAAGGRNHASSAGRSNDVHACVPPLPSMLCGRGMRSMVPHASVAGRIFLRTIHAARIAQQECTSFLEAWNVVCDARDATWGHADLRTAAEASLWLREVERAGIRARLARLYSAHASAGGSAACSTVLPCSSSAPRGVPAGPEAPSRGCTRALQARACASAQARASFALHQTEHGSRLHGRLPSLIARQNMMKRLPQLSPMVSRLLCQVPYKNGCDVVSACR